MSFGCPYLDCFCHCHYHLLLVISKIEMERGKVHSFDTARCYLQLFIAYFTPCIRLKLFQAKPFAFCYFRELFFLLVFQLSCLSLSCCVYTIYEMWRIWKIQIPSSNGSHMENSMKLFDTFYKIQVFFIVRWFVWWRQIFLSFYFCWCFFLGKQ